MRIMKEDRKCECDEERDADHLFIHVQCSLVLVKCIKEEFMMANDTTEAQTR